MSFRTIPFLQIRERIEALWLLDVGNADANAGGGFDELDWLGARIFANNWALRFWERYFWPEWTIVERRQFRQSWDVASTYSAPTSTAAVERYYWPAGQYFQALRAVPANQPPTDTSGNVNTSYWFACQTGYTGNDHASGQSYTPGTVVRNPADGRYYACHTAHTSTATLDAAKFGILTDFVRSVEAVQAWETTNIGKTKAVWDSNPDINPSARKIDFRLRGAAAIVFGSQNVVWVEFSQRAPRNAWSGGEYDADAGGVSGRTYYSTSQGEFYYCLQTAPAATVITGTAYFELVPFPWVLRDCVAQAAYAEMLRADERQDEGSRQEARALRMAEQELLLIERQQGQAQRLPVITR